ncbi:actin-like protein [Gorgonomyces haynaldii]|nr:actin-like protein [Gorgonomyces haynaldii]
MLQTNHPIVIDNGSGVIKAGFAGQDQPQTYLPSLIGRPKHLKIMAGAIEQDSFIGRSAQEHRGLLHLKYPMEHGIVKDWLDMERVWNWIYRQELKCSPEDHPVLLTEPPLNPRQNRDQMCQVFFETFNCPALYVSVQAVLALYSSGRTTGLVLDIGDGVSHCVPVYEGFAIPNAIQRMDLAGRDVTSHLQLLLKKQGINLTTSAEKDLVRIIKEKASYVSLNPSKEEKEFQNKDQYTLPDGQTIKLGSERFNAPEILFQPHRVGLEYPGVSYLVTDAINRVDLDLRASLYSNIVLSGGTTLLKGFGDRLLQEVKKQAMRDVKIKIFAPPERTYSTWIGGSILAGLGTFKKMWVTAQEYQEDPDIIHKKFAI